MTEATQETVAVAGRSLPRQLNVGVVGATGNVGTVMLEVLAERGVALNELRVFASERSVGRTLRCGERTAEVEDLATADPSGLDVALFSAGASRAREHAARFAQAGCVVIDNSSAFRMDAGMPLVVPEVNAHALRTHRGIIANPNCSTIQLVVALAPIQEAAGLERVVVTTFQSVSGTGKAAMDELEAQNAARISGAPVEAAIYPHPISANVLPHCDVFDDEGVTKEERKLVDESRKIMGLPDLRIWATCTRVPVRVGHSEAVHLQTSEPLSPSAARELLAAAPGVTVVDDPAGNGYPMPIDVEGRDDVLVGRIRRDPSVENGLAMFVVGDNLRKGAATNAVQILEALQA
jgi:aspartate-semialdehyde dehydrogenase